MVYAISAAVSYSLHYSGLQPTAVYWTECNNCYNGNIAYVIMTNAGSMPVQWSTVICRHQKPHESNWHQ